MDEHQIEKLEDEKEEVADLVEPLCDLVDRWPGHTSTSNLQEQAADLKRRVDDLREDEFQVAFAGEYSSGKSTLINSLLGQPLLSTGKEAKTAVVTYIRHRDEFPKIQDRLEYDSGDKLPESPFAVIQYESTESGKHEFESVLKEFKEWLKSEDHPVTNVISNGVLEVGRKGKDTPEVLETLVQQLRAGGEEPEEVAGEIQPGTVKSFREEVAPENDDRLLSFEDKFRTSKSVPDEVEEGVQLIEADRLDDFVSKAEDNSNSEQVISDWVKQIDVFIDHPLLSRGGILVDLPGASSADDADLQTTMDYIRDEEVDAVLIVFDFTKPASISNTIRDIRDEIRDQKKSVRERIFLVANRIDANWTSEESFEKFSDTYVEHFREFVSNERLFFTSSLLSLHLSELDPISDNGSPAQQDNEKIKRFVKKKAKKDGEFAGIFEDYVREFSTLSEESPEVLTEEGSSSVDISATAIDYDPNVAYEASRHEGVEEMINNTDQIKKGTLGIHKMFRKIKKYIMKTQVERKISKSEASAEKVLEEAYRIIKSQSEEIKSRPSTKGEYILKEKEEMGSKFREARQKLDGYLRRLHNRLEREIQGSLKRTFEKEKESLKNLASTVAQEIKVDEMRKEIGSSYPSETEEAKRVCRKLDISTKNLESVKYGKYVEEVLCKIVDTALRISSAKIKDVIDKFISKQYRKLEGILKSEEVIFEKSSEPNSPWNNSFYNAMYDSGVMSGTDYEKVVKKKIEEIMSDEIDHSKSHVDRELSYTSVNMVSIYKEYAEEHDGKIGEDENVRRLVSHDGINTSACTNVAKHVLEGTVTKYVEGYAERERIPLAKQVLEDRPETLYGHLKSILSDSSDFCERRKSEVAQQRRQEFDAHIEAHVDNFNDHNSLKEELDTALESLRKSSALGYVGTDISKQEIDTQWSDLRSELT